MKPTILATILVSALLLAGTTTVRAADNPTFSKEVAPILFQNCVTCHRPGEAAPFALLTYEDAKKRGKLIAQLTQSHQMPPWKAEKSDFAFRGERRLSDGQIATLQQWLAAGMPEGNKADLPAQPKFASEWTLGKPDLVVKMPKAYHVPAEGRDIYRNFAVSLGLKEDKWVKAIEFRPSTPVVHHSLFFLDASGTAAEKELASGEVGSRGGMGRFGGGVAGPNRAGGRGPGAGGLGGILGGLGGTGGPGTASIGLGGWAVGAQARALPDGLAYRITKGSDLILSTHFHPAGKPEDEASTIALYFTDKTPAQRFMGLQLPMGFGVLAGIDIPAGKKDFTIEDSFKLPVDVRAFGINAHAHYLGKDFSMTAKLPDGTVKTLLRIPDWDFAWQEQYAFKDYVDLPKGTILHVKMVYDNSAENPHNPTNPPRRVRWGQQTTDEMGSMTLEVVATRENEFSKLQEAYGAHVGEALLKMAGNRRGQRGQ